MKIAAYVIGAYAALLAGLLAAGAALYLFAIYQLEASCGGQHQSGGCNSNAPLLGYSGLVLILGIGAFVCGVLLLAHVRRMTDVGSPSTN
jgi:hypothetical protein